MNKILEQTSIKKQDYRFYPLNLENRRFLITGAASGMGRATAIYLSKLGANLLLADINQEQLEVTHNLCESANTFVCVDLTDIEKMKTLIMADVEEQGKLNGMVHCAGLPYIAPLKVISETIAMKIFKINTYAGLELAKLFTSKKIYTGDNGSIIFISSVYGVVGSVANAGYSMTKGAIQSLTKSLAIELAPRKIRVNCIAPGFIRTEMGKQIDHNFDAEHDTYVEKLHPLGLGSPDDIAAGIAFLFSDMSKWITGTILNIDGGFTAQ
jgi:NAD(P)-dependent dehydrogenase (short-subunit alcohol dehydrogenase family)